MYSGCNDLVSSSFPSHEVPHSFPTFPLLAVFQGPNVSNPMGVDPLELFPFHY